MGSSLSTQHFILFSYNNKKIDPKQLGLEVLSQVLGPASRSSCQMALKSPLQMTKIYRLKMLFPV